MTAKQVTVEIGDLVENDYGQALVDALKAAGLVPQDLPLPDPIAWAEVALDVHRKQLGNVGYGNAEVVRGI